MTQNTKHTPAPWEIGRADRGEDAAMVYCNSPDDAYNGVRVADCNTNLFLSKEQSFINARLIAAAPELLEACEIAADYMHLHSSENTKTKADYSIIRSAIAKARG
jgi:hypothetical protein